MRAFDKKHKFNDPTVHQDIQRLNKTLNGKFNDAVEQKMFTEQFCDAELFFEFRKELMVTIGVAELFTAEKIDLYHYDRCYSSVEVVVTDHGRCLCVPVDVSFREFNAVVKSYLVEDESEEDGVKTKKK